MRGPARRPVSGLLGLLGAAALSLAQSACGLQLPVDPDGTLERIIGGELRVGASPSGDLVRVDGGEVTGPLAELIEGFADRRDAAVSWNGSTARRISWKTSPLGGSISRSAA